MKLIAKQRTERFTTAAEIIAAAAELLAALPAAVPESSAA